MKLFVVGKIDSDDEFRRWELIGIFDSEDAALAACRTENHFIGPAALNYDIGDDWKIWPDVRYPKRGVGE